MSERIVIVGGGPAGHAAARGYRAAGGAGAVTLVTDDDRPPYQRPPLTKELLRGEAGEEELPLAALEDVALVYGEAVALDPDARVVALADGRRLEYTGAVLATGAEPVRIEVDHDDVHVVRTARHALALRDRVSPGTRVVVVGTGFIGCEAAASLAARGAAVTVVGQEDVVQGARLGEAAGERLAGWLREAGCVLELGRALSARDTAAADVVVLATGATPRVSLAGDAGLRMGEGGRAIAADVALRTTADGVYAAGDACEAQHPGAGRPLRVEHWGDALAQGEVAGRRLAGDHAAVWDAVPGFWSTIGARTLKYAAWGDGFASSRLVEHDDGAWTVWYADADGACVGVLTHGRDADYERGRELIAA